MRMLRFLAEALLLLSLLVTATNVVDAARSSRSRYSSYRSYRSSYYSYSYRGPVYTRRLSPSLIGAMYFTYISRYPSHFSYRRTVIGSSGLPGDSCANYMALDNGSYIGIFTCPFLEDEPNSWTKCCGYEGEQFCCDPAYDDSWRLPSQGLSVVSIVFIIGGCLTFFAIVGWLAYSCVKKRTVTASRSSCAAATVSAATAGSAVSPQTYVAPVQVISKTTTGGSGDEGQQVTGSNPPPYPTSFGGAQQTGMENQGFEPTPPYPLYPPPYPCPGAGVPGPR